MLIAAHVVLINHNGPNCYLENLDKPIVKLSISKALFSKRCAVIGCTNENTEVHHVRLFRQVKHSYIIIKDFEYRNQKKTK